MHKRRVPEMPYKREGSTIFHKKGGKWSKKQAAKSPENAKRAMRLLNAIDHGYDPEKKGLMSV